MVSVTGSNEIIIRCHEQEQKIRIEGTADIPIPSGLVKRSIFVPIIGITSCDGSAF